VSEQILEAVRGFVSEMDRSTTSRELDESLPLLDHGVLDSLSIYRLVTFLESRFGIQVLDEDLVPDNFVTLSSITQYVERRVASTP